LHLFCHTSDEGFGVNHREYAREAIFLGVSIGITRGWSDNSDLFRREDTLTKCILTVALAKRMASLDGHTDEETKQVATKDRSKFVRFGPESVFVIAQNHNPRFGTLRKEILAALYCQDAHSREACGAPFLQRAQYSPRVI
jgi:hypothetical protein